MPDERTHRRRALLRVLAAVLGVAGTGCQVLQDDAPSAVRTADEPATASATESPTPTATPTATLGSAPTVDVPESTLIAEPLPVTVTEIPPGTTVDLVVRSTDPELGSFEWRREHTADDDGRIATAVGAMASGPHPRMALAALADYEGEDARPLLLGGQDSVGLRVQIRRDGDVLTEDTTERVYEDPAVSFESVPADDLVGALYEPAGEGPHPPVVVLHGSGGFVPNEYCRLLATQGYAALGLQYFGEGDPIPSEFTEVPLGYFDRAVDWLQGRESTTDEGIGLVGVSRGVEAALLTGAAHDGPAAVVGYGGSGILYPAPTGAEDPAWTRDGDPVATPDQTTRFFTRAEEAQGQCGDVGDCAFDDPESPCDALACLLDAVESSDPAVYEAVTLPAEDVAGPVTLVSGSEDTVWPASVYGEIALARLADADHEHPYGHHVYDGAGHLFTRPYARNSLQGGTRADNARAAVRSWVHALDTLTDTE